jgi:hypothetical protein
MEKHDEEEIMRLLEEAEEEVIAEIEIDEELLDQRDGATTYDSIPPGFDDVPVTRDGPSHPPIDVEFAVLNNISEEARRRGESMGWNGPSATNPPQDA